MKNLSCSSSKSLNKIFLQMANSQSGQSQSDSFHKTNLGNIGLNSKKLLDKFYYKNPQFLNDINIQKQINILLTNINHNNKNNFYEKLPKLNIENNNNNRFNNKENNYNKKDNNKLPKLKTSIRNYLNTTTNNISNKTNNDKSVDYSYKSIFPSYPLFKEKFNLIDNKLNLIYCQDESQYKYYMNKRRKLKGTNMIIEEDAEKIKEKVSNIKEKVKFMKNVMDYSYPNFLLAKIKIWKQNLKEIKGEEKLLPEEEQKFQIKNKNNIMTNYLKKNIKVYPLKVE